MTRIVVTRGLKVPVEFLGTRGRINNVMGEPLPDGRRIMIPERVCNRCGKFKDFPSIGRTIWRSPGTFVRLQ